MSDILELYRDRGVVASKIRYRMLELKKGKLAMAREIGVNPRTFVRILDSDPAVSEQTMAKVIKYLGLDQ
jgi:plasmid maintenance system antidote protein VapI